MLNDYPFYVNRNKRITLKLLYISSGHLVASVSHTGILRAKPLATGENNPSVYGMVHANGFVSINVRVEPFVIYLDNTDDIPTITVMFERVYKSQVIEPSA